MQYESLYREKAKENQLRTSENRVLQKSAEQKIDTRKELAKIAGVSHDTIAKAKVIQQKAKQEIFLTRQLLHLTASIYQQTVSTKNKTIIFNALK